MNMTTKTVEIFTDGACSGNPGPGGWGALLRYGDTEKELSGGEGETTNNRMELMGAIMALEVVHEAVDGQALYRQPVCAKGRHGMDAGMDQARLENGG